MKKHVLFLIFIVGWSLSLFGQPESPTPDRESSYPVKPGDFCLVCNLPHRHVERVIVYRGRRVALCAKHVQTFLQDPEKYFSRLQPRGALFHEEAVSEKPLRWGWFGLGLWVTLSLLCAAIGCSLAIRQGRSASQGFWVGLLGNVVGLYWLSRQRGESSGVALPLTKIPQTPAPRQCPRCGEWVHPAARRCRACGNALQPLAPSEVDRAGLHGES